MHINIYTYTMVLKIFFGSILKCSCALKKTGVYYIYLLKFKDSLQILKEPRIQFDQFEMLWDEAIHILYIQKVANIGAIGKVKLEVGHRPAVSRLPVMAAAVAGAELTEGDQLEVQLILNLPGLFTQLCVKKHPSAKFKNTICFN